MKSFVVTSAFHGRLEIPGKKEPLFYGGTHTYIDVLPEKVMYFLGEDKLTVTEVIPVEIKKAPEAVVAVPSYDEQKTEKPSVRKSEKNS